MTRLRRIATHDRIFFVTTNLERHIPPLSSSERTSVLEIIDAEHRRESFSLFGYAVMPDHLHLLLSPVGQDLPCVMRDIKSASGYRLKKARTSNASHLFKGAVFPETVAHVFRREEVASGSNRSIWQRRYFDHIIRRVHDFWDKLEYIHQNPVTAGLAKFPEDWPWSSYAAYAKRHHPPIPIDAIELPVDRTALLWPAP